MVESVMVVTPRSPRGLVTTVTTVTSLMMQRVTVCAPHAPVAVKTPVHVAVEILKLIKGELYF